MSQKKAERRQDCRRGTPGGARHITVRISDPGSILADFLRARCFVFRIQNAGSLTRVDDGVGLGVFEPSAALRGG